MNQRNAKTKQKTTVVYSLHHHHHSACMERNPICSLRAGSSSSCSPEQPTHELLLVFSRQQTETQNRTEPEPFFKHAFLCVSSLSLSPFLSSLTGSEERSYICSVLTHVLSFPRAHGFLKSRLSRIEQIKKNLPLIKELKQKRVMRFKI